MIFKTFPVIFRQCKKNKLFLGALPIFGNFTENKKLWDVTHQFL